MTEHLDILIPILIGLYLFLLGMGVPLPPGQFKGSKATAAGGLFIIIIAAALMPSSAPKPGNTPAALVAENLKKEIKLPAQEGEGLTVIDITSEDDTLIYVFRIDRENAEARGLAERMGEKLLETACQNKDYRIMLKNGVSVAMSYKDRNGRPAGKTIIRPRTCNL